MNKNYLTVLLLCFVFGSLHAQVSMDTAYVFQTDNCGFQIEVSLQQPTCTGVNNGAIQIDVSNSDAVLLSWINTAADGNVADALPEGIYTAFVANDNCVDTLNFELENQLSIVAPDIYENFCGDGGNVDLLEGIVTDGTVFSFEVETIYGTPVECINCPEANNVFFDESSYLLVHITDANGCIATRKVFVTVLEPIELAVINLVEDSCNGNASFTIQAQGGTGNYFYSLNGGDNLQSNPNFAELAGGTSYLVSVYDQNAGCSEDINVDIPLAQTLPDLDFTVEIPQCFGEETGAIIGTPNTSTEPYLFTLTPEQDVTFQNTATFNNLTSGNYTVYVVTDNETQCITPIADLEIGSPEPLELTENITGPDCPGANGEVEFLVNGGLGEFLFSVDGENYLPQNSFMDLPPGLYTGYVQNDEGCIDSSEFVIEELLGPEIEVATQACCPGMPTGIVIVESGKLFTGGDYTFSLDSLVWQNENFFEGLPAGPDTMYIQDPDGCVLIVPFYIPQALRPELEMDINHVGCPGEQDGSINVQVTGGGPMQDYAFALAEDSFQESGFFEGLGPGIYPLLVMDSVPCIHDYLFEIVEPSEFSYSAEITGPDCFGENDGTLLIHAVGGTMPYVFALDGGAFQSDSLFLGVNGGGHEVVVVDALQCAFSDSLFVEEPKEIDIDITVIDESCDNNNGAIVCYVSGGTEPFTFLWNTGDTLSTLTNIEEGEYQVSVTDAAGCEKQASVIVENLDGPNLWGNLTDVECNGTETGAIDLHVASGSPPFVYTWSNGAYTQDIEEIPAGNYLVTVTDIHFCTSSKSFTIHEPEPIHLNYQSGQAGDYWFINLIVEGGTPPYTYEWSNGETTEDLFNLMAGMYSVTMTDDLGCSKSLEVFVGVNATNEPFWAEELNLYPNPVGEILNVQILLPKQEEVRISVFNHLGQLMLKEQYDNNVDSQIPLSMRLLPPGGYWVAIEVRGEMVVRYVVHY